ncbi:MAG: hypothetical protein QM733_24495 [Ilumatobacteraceae bacterium]
MVGYEISETNISMAEIWKNGVATPLSSATKSVSATSVFVSGLMCMLPVMT